MTLYIFVSCLHTEVEYAEISQPDLYQKEKSGWLHVRNLQDGTVSV